MTAMTKVEREEAEEAARNFLAVVNPNSKAALVARALLSSSSAERGMREALETIATGYRDLNSCDFAALARVTSANALASLQQATRGEDAATASTDC